VRRRDVPTAGVVQAEAPDELRVGALVEVWASDWTPDPEAPLVRRDMAASFAWSTAARVWLDVHGFDVRRREHRPLLPEWFRAGGWPWSLDDPAEDVARRLAAAGVPADWQPVPVTVTPPYRRRRAAGVR
jgi:hypothetical protein